MTRSLADIYRESPCVFLDCDGVIFDSNGFKLQAVRHALAGAPEPALGEMDAYWSANGGVSRYEKLRHFFSEILKVGDVEPKVTAAAARFSEFSRRAYVDCPPLPEALWFAAQTGKKRCFVVSGTDQDELRDVFAAKALTPRFAEVCGSPTTKLAHVERILKAYDCTPARAVFIGDGGGDFAVARQLRMPFVYLNQYSEWRSAKLTLSGVANVLICESWTEILTSLSVAPAQ